MPRAIHGTRPRTGRPRTSRPRRDTTRSRNPTSRHVSLDQAQLRRFATSLAASEDLWGDLVRHSRDVRLYEQIWDADDVNAWLICWSEGQDTGFHDHDDSAA